MAEDTEAAGTDQVRPRREAGRTEPPPSGPHRAGSPAPAPRPHPKPPVDQVEVSSLNDAIRRELWYVDTLVAAPFRIARRWLRGGAGRTSSLREGADELLWAAEGMTRLPVKALQAAFGEQLGPKSGQAGTNRQH